MSRKDNYTRQHETECEFTRAAWEMVRDTELGCSVRIVVDMVPTGQRGVFYIGMRALSTLEEEKNRQVGFVQGSYPNGRAGTLSAYLFAVSNSLAQMCTNVRATERQQAQVRF